MDIANTVAASLGISLPICLVLWLLLSEWYKARITSSVAHEYARQLEAAKHQDQVRLKAACIAELLAEWLSMPDDFKRLNNLTFEAFLWLPDNIASDLSNVLSHKPGLITVRDVLLKVRMHLYAADTLIDASQIIVFTKKP